MMKLQVYTFWDSIAHYEAKSVHFFGLMNSATKSEVAGDFMVLGFRFRVEASGVGSLWFGVGGFRV